MSEACDSAVRPTWRGIDAETMLADVRKDFQFSPNIVASYERALRGENGPSIPWKVLTIRQVDVFEGSRVRKWITTRERSLTAEEIDQIYDAAVEVLPPRYPED